MTATRTRILPVFLLGIVLGYLSPRASTWQAIAERVGKEHSLQTILLLAAITCLIGALAALEWSKRKRQ